MTKGLQEGAPDPETEKRRILNYVGHLSLELAAMADRAGATEVGIDLRRISDRVMDEIRMRS